jgi:hypothetical protein
MTLNKYLSIGLFTIIAFILLFQTCGKNEIIRTQRITDTLIVTKLVNINKDSLKVDSLLKIKQRVKIVYKQRTDSIYISSPDTCKTYITMLVNNCNDYLSLNDSIIESQMSLINEQRDLYRIQRDLINKQNDMLYSDSLHIVKLNKKIKIKNISIGIISAVGLGALLR